MLRERERERELRSTWDDIAFNDSLLRCAPPKSLIKICTQNQIANRLISKICIFGFNSKRSNQVEERGSERGKEKRSHCQWWRGKRIIGHGGLNYLLSCWGLIAIDFKCVNNAHGLPYKHFLLMSQW